MALLSLIFVLQSRTTQPEIIIYWYTLRAIENRGAWQIRNFSLFPHGKHFVTYKVGRGKLDWPWNNALLFALFLYIFRVIILSKTSLSQDIYIYIYIGKIINPFFIFLIFIPSSNVRFKKYRISIFIPSSFQRFMIVRLLTRQKVTRYFSQARLFFEILTEENQEN